MTELNKAEKMINDLNNNELRPCTICGTLALSRQNINNPQLFSPTCDDCYQKRVLEFQRDEIAKTQLQEESQEDKSDFTLEETIQPEKPLNIFSQGWQLEIQETQQFKDKNIVVLVNAKGQHLFMKAVKMLNGFIELTPISRQEATENQINYEESLNESYFESEFEESQSEFDNSKIVHKFNSQDPESMKLAAKTALEIANRLEGKNAKIQESTETQTEKEDIESLRAERNTYKEMLDLVAQKEFEKKKAQLGAPDSIQTVEELKAFSEGKKANQRPIVQAGCVPLSSQQSSSEPQVFDSQEALIDNLRDRCSTQNPNKEDRNLAKAQLDALMLKCFKGQKDCNKPFDFTMPKDVSINDVLNAKYQRRKKLAKGVQ